MSQPWSDAENDRLIAHYLQELQKELRGQGFLRGQTFLRPMVSPLRTLKAVSYKTSNISAILVEMGLPALSGYAPLGHYQLSLKAAVERGLQTFPIASDAFEAATRVADTSQPRELHLVSIPRLRPDEQMRERRGIHVNYAELEANNRSLGSAGEKAVVDFLREDLRRVGRPDLAERVEWVSKTRGDGLGYDVLAFDADGMELFVKVKTTRRDRHQPFYLSSNEVEASMEYGPRYRLYRLFEWDAPAGAKAYVLEGCLSSACSLQPVTFMAVPDDAAGAHNTLGRAD